MIDDNTNDLIVISPHVVITIIVVSLAVVFGIGFCVGMAAVTW